MNQLNINEKKTPRPEQPKLYITEVIDRESRIIKEAAYNGYCQMPEHSEILSALDRIAEAVSKQQPSDGGEFERVLDEVYDLYPTHMKDIRSKEIVSRLVSAYYHDRNVGHAADKQRITELEYQLKKARGEA